MRSFDARALRALIAAINPLRAGLEKRESQISSALDAKGCSETDLRRTAVQDIITSLALLQFQYIFVAESLLDYRWWDAHGLPHLTAAQKMENASRFADYVSFSAFHYAYASYEGSLRQFHHSIDPLGLNESTAGIYKVFDALSNSCGLAIDKTKFGELHVFLGLIRNTIHNLGCYRNANEPSKTVTYAGQRYTFTHLKPALFLYPELICRLIYDIGCLLADIAEDGVLMGLPKVVNPYRDGLPK